MALLKRLFFSINLLWQQHKFKLCHQFVCQLMFYVGLKLMSYLVLTYKVGYTLLRINAPCHLWALLCYMTKL